MLGIMVKVATLLVTLIVTLLVNYNTNAYEIDKDHTTT